MSADILDNSAYRYLYTYVLRAERVNRITLANLLIYADPHIVRYNLRCFTDSIK